MSPSRLRLPWVAPSAGALRRLPGVRTALPEARVGNPLPACRFLAARCLRGGSASLACPAAARKAPAGSGEHGSRWECRTDGQSLLLASGRVRVTGAGRETQRLRALFFLFLPLIPPQVCLPAEASQHRSGCSGAGRKLLL